MAWIESHQDLATHPKTFAFAEFLGVPIPQAIGHLHLLWYWALDHHPSGDLLGVTTRAIARAAQWEGSPKKFQLALHMAGFLDSTPDSDENDQFYTIHNWPKYSGRYFRDKEAARKRMRTLRERSRNTAEQNPNVTRTFGSKEEERLSSLHPSSPSKNQEEEKKEPSPSAPALTHAPEETAAAQTDFIASAISAWETQTGQTAYPTMLTDLQGMESDFKERNSRAPPASWPAEAIKRTLDQGKRKWAYTRTILRAWIEQGYIDDATHQPSNTGSGDQPWSDPRAEAILAKQRAAAAEREAEGLRGDEP